jgi:hydroxymethylpyrimidine pyrophosphatase-like HAD family hydrolase
MNEREKILKILKHKFRLIAFDWDGTAVKSRKHPVDDILGRLETLLQKGIVIVIITGTHFGNVDGQFTSKVNPRLKKNIFVCVNRGSEVFGFDDEGKPIVVYRRIATDEENKKMDAVSQELQTVAKAKYGIETDIIYNRFNRRKWDIIPLPEWADPPKERIDQLLIATEKRLKDHGIKGGIQELIDLLEEKCNEHKIELRVTTDVKHLEYGLTDKADSVEFILDEIAGKRGIPNKDILFLGDEFGPIGSFEGSDFKMFSNKAKGATYISVGKEPNGVPEGVLYYGGGTEGFTDIIDAQIAI